VSLRFPSDWKKDPAYQDRPYFGVEKPSPARHGFFQLLAMAGEESTPELVCKGLAEHVVKPFGTHPTVQSMKVQGQDGCLVWPSDDQGAPWDAALVFRTPAPMVFGGESYDLLELDADKDYILKIIKTLRFIPPAKQAQPSAR
jgi:TolB protein